jgi:hypothetical protein
VSVARPSGRALRARCNRDSRGRSGSGGTPTDVPVFSADGWCAGRCGRIGSLADRMASRGRLHSENRGRGRVAATTLRHSPGADCHQSGGEHAKTGCHRPTPTRGILCSLNGSIQGCKGLWRRRDRWWWWWDRLGTLGKVERLGAGVGGFRCAFPLEAFEEIRQRTVVRRQAITRGRCQDGIDQDEFGTQWLCHVDGIVGFSVDGHEPGQRC